MLITSGITDGAKIRGQDVCLNVLSVGKLLRPDKAGISCQVNKKCAEPVERWELQLLVW